jgi:hypothetical protein
MRLADVQQRRTGGFRARTAAIASILILMWPALINGQPFFFSDTSSYVRAGEMAARMVIGPAARTIWTQDHPAPTPAIAVTAPRPATPTLRGNDPASGYIMAGRSPYFGIGLWLGWVSSQFWLFVVAQAVASYFLIGAALRCIGLDGTNLKLIVATALAVLSPLAVYNGVLLADALSGFGIAAFLILLAPRVQFARWEVALLAGIIIASAVSHLTHVVILAGLLMLVALFAAMRWLAWGQISRAVQIGGGALLIGVLSIIATSAAVKAQFGRAPVLVPLITARFIADGPGRDYIAAGCDGKRFAVCRIPYRGWTNSTIFLWSRDPATGAFLLADVDAKLAMSQEDKAFAMAVARAYPLETARFALTNTIKQLTDLRVDIVNEGCFVSPACIGHQFPEQIVSAIAQTPGGRDAWPVPAMSFVVYAAAVASLAALATLLPMLWAARPEAARLICLWLLLVTAAMVANAFLGGAISEPQSRYQTRMAWLLPLLALLAGLAWRQTTQRQEGTKP